MQFQTTKFGPLEIKSDRILLFPDGILGFDSYRHWVLLAEGNDDAVGWLQSLANAQLAFLVVTPHRFVPNYAPSVQQKQVLTLPWASQDRVLVLVLVSDHNGILTANLKAPLAINVDRCLGRQIVLAEEQPLRFPLSRQSAPLRKCA
jgi:flagellar assembly factor FliW